MRAIVFDFDGVLVNSEPLHFNAFAAAAKTVGITLTEDEYFRELIGYDDRGAWRKLLELHNCPVTPQQLLKLNDHKMQVMRDQIYDKKYSPLLGVEETVRALWRFYPLAICSGAFREEIEAMLEGINLRDCFRIITAAEDVQNGKPDPEGYMITLAALSRVAQRKLDPHECLIVEDAPRVISAVRELGFQTLGVPTSYGEKELGAHHVTKSMKLDDLRKAMPGLKTFEE
ncbi:MAG: HAD family phosphatase [Tepidisphaeraceae bacterium]